MGIVIEDIEPALQVQDDGSNESSGKKSNQDNMVLIIIGAVLGAVALVALVSLIVVVVLKNQSKYV